ncbi:hypothetical protein AB1Y20_003388 [Prymnesium parvum]|uniref:Amidase domain-containing protein n=1 Tax=Prymnesium parvum TaxID=97485 RepID=A0AB34JBQ0_PRYPA
MPLSNSAKAAAAASVAALVALVLRYRRLYYIRHHTEWWRLSAVEVVAALRAGQVTPRILVEQALARIHQTNGQTHAIVTVCAERALACADEVGGAGSRAPLYGLPVAIKDNQRLKGVRCTSGTPKNALCIPEASDPPVAALEAGGAIIIGTTNLPEAAGGSHTFGPLFPTASNPFDLGLTVGGSSGGSAAALATGTVWLASGTDLGGSLRNPPAYNGVVGIRPVPGRVGTSPAVATHWRGRWGIGLHSVSGPMGRTVADAALMLDVMSTSCGVGWEPSAVPTPPPPPEGGFLGCVQAALSNSAEGVALTPKTIAWSADLGGVMRGVQPEIIEGVRRAAQMLAEATGATVEEATPAGLERSESVFRTLRYSRMLDNVAGGPGPAAKQWAKDWMPLTKPEAVAEIIQATQSGFASRVAEAEHARQAIEGSWLEFMSRYDVVLLPSTSLLPFPKDLRYPWKIGEVEFDDFIGWMLPCSAISILPLPCCSVPIGLSADGLPLAVQMVGQPNGEGALLAAAALLERAVAASNNPSPKVPIDPTPSPKPPRGTCCSGPYTVEEAASHHRVPVTGSPDVVVEYLKSVGFQGMIT